MALPTPPPHPTSCSCGYCTFATPPTPGRRAYMTLDEVLAVARLGAEQGCTEALLTLGACRAGQFVQGGAGCSAAGWSFCCALLPAESGQRLPACLLPLTALYRIASVASSPLLS